MAQIHYGRASFSPLTDLPAYFVLGCAELDVATVATELADLAANPKSPEGTEAVLVFLDQPFLWRLGKLKEQLSHLLTLKVGT